MPNLTPQRIFRADFPFALARKLRAFFEADMGSIYMHLVHSVLFNITHLLSRYYHPELKHFAIFISSLRASMAPPTPNPPSSPAPSLRNTERDVAHTGVWAQHNFTNESNKAGDVVLEEHPDVGAVSTRDSGEILEEYKGRREDTAEDGRVFAMKDGGRGDASSSVGGEYGESEKGA
jgi:hypothetical protein